MRSLVVDIGSSNVKIYLAKMHAGKALEMKEADRFPTERSFFSVICPQIYSPSMTEYAG